MDKLLTRQIEQFAVRAYHEYATGFVSVPSTTYNPNNREWGRKYEPADEIVSFSLLEVYVKKYGFDFKEMSKQLGGEYSYKRAYSYY